MNRSRSRFRVSLGIGLIGFGSLQVGDRPDKLLTPAPEINTSAGAAPGGSGGVDAIRRAAVSWERRTGPERQVVDMVCLVPDLATFLEVIATWDESHAFPILIDDVELTFKFLRAFRPARIVRYPRSGRPIAADRLWAAAVTAVGRSWSSAGRKRPRIFPVMRFPCGWRRPRPGSCFLSPSSPMLAGAVALAAGRFQPLLRWEINRHYGAVPGPEEANELARDLEAQIAARIKHYASLGDDCDFLTLAGDWAYRYQNREGQAAFDDLVGRTAGRADESRWAFAGRLLGDTTTSVYRAMCSLFLQPETILLLNTYTDPNRPWTDYALASAADRLARLAPVTLLEGSHASLTDWSRLFEPLNTSGLILLNTSGTPTTFNLPGGPGQTGDIPASVPTAVLMIHSFSAQDPNDPDTIGGRWLANGAFVYFGAVNEPYLTGFRPPAQAAELIESGMPFGAALRFNPPEQFSTPWRLVYLGDPLFRLQPRAQRPQRLEQWKPVASWPAYLEYRQAEAAAPEATRLNWALKTALYRLQRTARPQQRLDPGEVLLAIRRDRLEARLRPIYDALLVDALIQAGRPGLLLERLGQIPAGEAGSVVERVREPLQMAALQKLVAARDFDQALTLWAEVIRVETGPAPAAEFMRSITDRVAALADTPSRRDDWRKRLRAALRGLDDQSPLRPMFEAELKRALELSAGPR